MKPQLFIHRPPIVEAVRYSSPSDLADIQNWLNLTVEVSIHDPSKYGSSMPPFLQIIFGGQTVAVQAGQMLCRDKRTADLFAMDEHVLRSLFNPA